MAWVASPSGVVAVDVRPVRILAACPRRRAPCLRGLLSGHVAAPGVTPGLRVSEATGLRWRNVDLASGRIVVEEGKTAAASRLIGDINPELRELLVLHRTRAKFTGPDDLVFATRNGREKGRSTIARQVLAPALERANTTREQAGRPPIARASCHDLRRTFCSLAFAAGASPAAVMQVLGHTSAALSLEVYSKVVAGATTGLGDSMAALVRGPEWTKETLGEDGVKAAKGSQTPEAVSIVAETETALVKENAL